MSTSIRSSIAYEYLGITRATAEEIFTRIQKAEAESPESPFDFIEFAYAVIDSDTVPDAETEDDDWTGCLSAMGFTQEFIEGIVAEGFEDIRFTASAKYWARDTVADRWLFLEKGGQEARDALARMEQVGAAEHLDDGSREGGRGRQQ